MPTASTMNTLSSGSNGNSRVLCEPCGTSVTTAIKQSKSALKKTKQNGTTGISNSTNTPTTTTATATAATLPTATTNAAATSIPTSNIPSGNLTEQSRLNIRKGGFKKEYEPCDHIGICTISNCICVQNSGFCEKFCACTRGCRHRFQGCCCKGKTGMYI